jgi:hypothetical protein
MKTGANTYHKHTYIFWMKHILYTPNSVSRIMKLRLTSFIIRKSILIYYAKNQNTNLHNYQFIITASLSIKMEICKVAVDNIKSRLPHFQFQIKTNYVVNNTDASIRAWVLLESLNKINVHHKIMRTLILLHGLSTSTENHGISLNVLLWLYTSLRKEGLKGLKD